MLVTVFYFILALVLLITIHEYGHFLVARLCGVKVLRFSFGFGRVLFRCKDRKGTEYVWSLWPLGGYVKMLDETEAPVPKKDRLLAFNNQSLMKRVLIVVAGPLFNFIFAFFALWLVAVIGMYSLAPIIEAVKPNSIAAVSGFSAGQEITALAQQPIASWRDFQLGLIPYAGSDATVAVTVLDRKTGVKKTLTLPLKNWALNHKKPNVLKSLGLEPFVPKIPAVIGATMPDMPGEKAGLKAGDIILSIDGKTISDWLDLVDYVQARPNTTTVITVKRQDKSMPVPVDIGKKLNGSEAVGFVGLMPQQVRWPKRWLHLQKEGPIDALVSSAQQTWALSQTTLVFIGRLISGKLSVKMISGPVGIAQGAGDSGRSGLVYYLSFLALVSISLGVLNLLPIPMLDGGHLLFYLVEFIKGSPLSEQTRIGLTYSGIVLLIGVMILAVTNDIMRLT